MTLAVASLLLLLEPQPGARIVSRDEILEAMRQSQGYDLTATANGARLQAEVVLRLVREARERDPDGPPLFIGRREWFEAYLLRSGLTADKAPLYVRLAHDHGQDLEADYRRDRTVVKVIEGPTPQLALNVRLGWSGGPPSYSYEDTLSSPRLRVTNKRLITYRLLDYGDRLLYDEIRGLHGRPTSGLLGVLFDIIGEAAVVESRMALSADGIQVSRTRSKKAFIELTTTVTVDPNGRAEKGLPPGRPDLAALEARLKVPLKLTYAPLR